MFANVALKLAEPIFLHVIRPVLKPYTPTIDYFLEHGAVFGDFFALLVSIPVEMAAEYLPQSWHANEEAMNSQPSAFLGEFEANRRPQLDSHTSSSGLPSSGSAHPVWHPPPMANDGTAENPSFANIYHGPPTPPLEKQSASAMHSDEWRRYPSLPSAYPATPAQTRHSTNADDETGYKVDPTPFPWPGQQADPATSTLPPGFHPSVQQ